MTVETRCFDLHIDRTGAAAMNHDHTQQHDAPNRYAVGLSGAYVILLLDVLARFGINEYVMLEPFGLNRQQLAEPANRISPKTMNDLLNRAFLLTGETSLAYHLGMQMRISTHGFIGFAIMTAANVGAALSLASRYISIRMPYCRLNVNLQPQYGELQLACDLLLEPLRSEVLLSLAIGILQMGQALTGKPILANITFDFKQPLGFERFSKLEQLAGAQLQFSQPECRARFTGVALDTPLVSADPVASQLALAQCEAELSALGLRDRLNLRVRELLTLGNDGFPNLEQITEKLHMSDRTLKRQLAAEGTSFSAILEEVRHRQAIALLSRSDFTLDRISECLGYSDVANFNRAFRRWTGKTPGKWRREPQ